MQALRAFEAAGRRLSFSDAATELFVTPGAVGYQIRSLEHLLGTPLFVRGTRSVRLTPAGVAYMATVRQVFDLLTDGTRAVRGPTRAVLRVSLLASFAVNWLIPRLPRFAAVHPDIDLQFEPMIAHADLETGETDLAIRYGPGGWPGVRAHRFLLERFAPVCSPALASGSSPIVHPNDLLGHVLLLSQAREPFEWLAWAASSDFDFAQATTWMLHDYNIVLEAAVSGQGVAIGRASLVADRLRSGELVEPLGPARPHGGIGHWLVTRHGKQSPEAAAFSAWILHEAKATTQSD